MAVLAGGLGMVLLPHIGSAEAGPRAGMARMAAENAVARARGEKPPDPVEV